MAPEPLILYGCVPYLVGAVISLFPEVAMRPRACLRLRRHPWAVVLQLSVWSQAFLLMLAICRRPYFSSFCVLAFLGVVLLVNNAKYRSLREPFVFQDFEYFTDAIKHPRLYLPFLGVLPMCAATFAVAAVVWSGSWLEPALSVPYWLLLLACELLIAVSWIVANFAVRRLPPASGDIAADLHEFGLVGALWIYQRQERRPVNAAGASPFLPLQKVRRNTRGRILPDLLTIQSESFFDARAQFPQLREDVLAFYDRLCALCRQRGRLAVPAWGANTIRTEFAFLTGIDLQGMGVHRYQPYRYLAASGLPTIASVLRGWGYRTICIHPYYGSFYKRKELMPLLGFDEFHDLDYFSGAAREGAYVSDIAVAEYVRDYLQARRPGPVYIHVITMENHGPLHLEKVGEDDRINLLRHPLPKGCDDLVAYARHLRNMDIMLDILATTLERSARPSGLCLFGDHVPIMPDVYRQLGTPPGPTDYLIWTPHGAASSPKIVNTRASDISMDLLRVMQLV
jgi:hypothetical protein